VKDDRFGYGFWPYILPYMSFVTLAQFSDRFPESWALALLAIKPAIPALLIAYFYSKGMYPELRGARKYARGFPLDVAVGLLSALLWVSPYLLLPESLGEVLGGMWPDRSEGFDPTSYGTASGDLELAIFFRMIGYACVTPVFEELFIRSFVMRFAEVYDKGKDFRDIAVARYSARGLWISTVFFTIGHVPWEWWVAVPWVVLTSLYFYWRGHIGSVIVVHAVANASILVAAVLKDGPLWFFV
jgi:CAAX prenyl protease-like protein